jgi:hypothetical protein
MPADLRRGPDKLGPDLQVSGVNPNLQALGGQYAHDCLGGDPPPLVGEDGGVGTRVVQHAKGSVFGGSYGYLDDRES